MNGPCAEFVSIDLGVPVCVCIVFVDVFGFCHFWALQELSTTYSTGGQGLLRPLSLPLVRAMITMALTALHKHPISSFSTTTIIFFIDQPHFHD